MLFGGWTGWKNFFLLPVTLWDHQWGQSGPMVWLLLGKPHKNHVYVLLQNDWTSAISCGPIWCCSSDLQVPWSVPKRGYVCHCMLIYMWEEKPPQWKPGSKGEGPKNLTLSLSPLLVFMWMLRMRTRAVTRRVMDSVQELEWKWCCVGNEEQRVAAMFSCLKFYPFFSSYMN